MRRIRFSKEHLSIQIIGRKRFCIGIFAGLFTAILISLAFHLIREIYRFVASISADLLILPDNELRFFNYFFSSLATTLGFCITIWIWMSNFSKNRRMDRLYKQLSRANALLFFGIILMLITRIGSIPPILSYGMPGYDYHFNLFEDFRMLFILLPLVIFLQSWASVGMVYRTGKWILVSFVICILTAFSLNMTTTVNQEKVNNSYYLRFEKDYQYLDKEISKAKADYGIQFENSTIDILKKWYSESSIEQVRSLKEAFLRSNPVSLDTIILQKMVIRNFKPDGYHIGRNSIDGWPYALPNDILKQIRLYDVNSNETKELFDVLKEEIDLINTPYIEWQELGKFTETERRRSLGANYYIPRSVIRRIIAVKDSLVRDVRYTDLSRILPEINRDRLDIVP
ncbi:MAG TPA: hypothetical protein VK212_08125 [Lentimicrobium sp.]|nr:hypothetical protein [Lentimicrobium sp.]